MPESNPAVRLGILADDLTGAADSAARCRAAGLTVEVCLQPPTTVLSCDALALTSDSRHLPAAAAARRVRAVLGSPALERERIWYKKIDSTGRGNLGSEIDAMLEALDRSFAVVCPAFPAQARGLSDGYVVPASHLGRQMHLPSLLAEQSQHPVAELPLEQLRRGAAFLRRRVVELTRDGTARIVVLDAMSDDDLATIVAAQSLLPDALLCGSAGLVGVLASRLTQPPPAVAACDRRVAHAPALLVVGSGSAAAHRQISFARSHGAIQVVDGHRRPPGPLRRDTLVHLPVPAEHTGLDGEAARAGAGKLAAVALSALEQGQPALLVLVGGDTATAVLERLGITRLSVLCELLPGMPLARGVDRYGVERGVILKSGNHGADSTLVELVALARRHSASEEHHGAA